MKPITHLHPSRAISDQSDQPPGFDPEVAFSDPVRYLAGLGIEYQLISGSDTAAVQEAA